LKENEIGRACSMRGRDENFFGVKTRKKEPLENLDVFGRVILK
jgi:hypothetical protein